MTAISATGSALLDRISASRAALNAARARATPEASASSAATSARNATRVTLDASAANEVVYARPNAGFGSQRAWASSALQGDGVSTLMVRNSGREAHSLADRWRGLGGALLSQLAATGKGYQQSLADFFGPAEAAGSGDGTDGVDGATSTPGSDAATAAAALQQDALNGVATNATQLSLKIQTRSGQTVELKLTVNDGMTGGTRGLQAGISTSGTLSAAEREALDQLAGGLDGALEGLGQQPPALDLSKLMNYDRGVLTGLDLQVKAPNASTMPGKLQAFSLQLGDDKKSLSLTTPTSQIALEVDAAAPLGEVSGRQRWSAIDTLMKQIDTAAERSHADGTMVSHFKDAMRQLQAPALDTEASTAPGASDAIGLRSATASASTASTPTTGGTLRLSGTGEDVPLSAHLQEQLQPLQSGLADFKASFSGDSQKTTRYGGVKEQGHAEYKISQSSSAQRNEATGGLSITQTQTEELDARLQKAELGLLDLDGNYDATTIRDSKTVTTMIETAKDSVTRALRKTDEHQLKTVATLESGRVVGRRSESPLDRSDVERLR